MIGKIFVFAVLMVGVNCRYLVVDDVVLAEDGVIVGEDGTGYFSEPLQLIQLEPAYNSRVRRQAQTTISVDGKTGIAEFGAKIPVTRNDQNVLSVTGTQSAVSRSMGLALDNKKGHGLSLSQKTIPEFGKQLTAAGKLNLLNTDRHNVDATAFVTKNMPKFPEVPNFNTYGGAVDYTFDKKIGATLGAAQTDFLKRTDVSALGHLNLFKNQDTSFDFNAGATRSFSPFFPKSSWEPTYGFAFSKSW